MVDAPTIESLLRERFGFERFRPGQREAISELLGGGQLLCIQPTGHGKSLLYQLPSCVLDGMTLVISPLLALMRDQLGHLERHFGIPAASFNSDQSDEENDEARAAVAAGRVKILFVAPEQLDRVDRLGFILSLPVSLVVVDEAHCISTWGHDFRPAYREIARLVAGLRARRPDLRVLGLTATADERVEQDIRTQLAPADRPLVVQRLSMDRPNLALSVVPLRSQAEKLAWLAAVVPRLPRPGLIYCATRQNTEIVAEYLESRGVDAQAYHAGMAAERKRALQEDFLAGRFRVVAATNALGMGIDKADLRYVIHFDFPGSITAYYQEVGRAGRDGEPARGVILYDRADRRIQEYFIHSAKPAPEDFAAVRRVVAEHGEPPRLVDLRIRTGLHPTRVTVVVAELVEQGFLAKRSEQGRQVYAGTGKPGEPDLARYEDQNAVRNRGLQRMIAYCEGRVGCLMRTLRVALGDGAARDCGRCVHCRGHDFPAPDAVEVRAAAAWVAERPVIVPGFRKILAPGLAAYDGQLRGDGFLRFMRGRRDPSVGLSEEARQRLATIVRRIERERDIGALVCLPSRSWAQRSQAAAFLRERTGVPAHLDWLSWVEEPPHRQGELLNNDQRRANVAGRLGLSPNARPTPDGAVLLLDDYAGSGATLREAARVLREAGGVAGEIIPVTVALVRWRLGRPGIV